MAQRHPRSIALTFASLLLAACGQSGAPSGTPPPANDFVQPQLPGPSFAQTVSKEIAIPMADGVRLGATVTWPSLDGETPAPGQFPVVVSVTPYGRTVLGSVPDREVFATRGIIGVAVDTRGTGGSEGNLSENYFSPLEASDSAAVIEYFGTQDYSSGKVGMAGGSYVGITQLLAAAQQPPHLAAIVPQVVLSDLYRDGYAHGGIVNLLFDVQYLGVQGGPGLIGINTSPELIGMTVGGKIQQLLGKPIAFDYLARPDDDAFYRDRSPIYVADRIRVPVLLLGGWRDGLSQRGAPEMYHALAQRSGVETRLYMDPCTHKGCGAPFAPTTNPPDRDDLQATMFEFLAKYLLDAPTPARSAVRAYVQGSNRYIQDSQWPPRATRYQRLYLADGALSATRPEAETSAAYFSNPLAGLSMTFDQYGTVAASPYIPLDQRLETAQGITYRTAVLEQPLILVGPAVLSLVAKSTASDTDWIVKLADVHPDGTEAIITNGYLRASHRELDTARSREGVPYHTHVNPTPIEPGAFLPYEVEVWPTAYELAAGHRLQVRIVSYDVPTHAPASIHLDLADPLATQLTPMLPAINTLREGGATPSSILLPVYQDQGRTP
ncbi:MAG TPA: CocE/NonD family hydrolase [Solimonas sp.]|nr:CocE/NonD family hydrolase [Solimonas sp.]